MCLAMSVTKQDSNIFGKQERELMWFFVFYVGTNGYESCRKKKCNEKNKEKGAAK